MPQTDDMRAYQREYRRNRRHSDSEYRERTNRNTNKGLRKLREDEGYAQQEREANYARGIKSKYGLSMEEYKERMLRPCAICGSVNGTGGRRPVLDHDHVTGMVRDTLCHHCNVGLGHFSDDPSIIVKAADYLSRWKGEKES